MTVLFFCRSLGAGISQFYFHDKEIEGLLAPSFSAKFA